jgi:hypothetical protein
MTERERDQSHADKPSEPSTDQPKLMISTRLQKSLITNLKAIAKIRGVKYQALIRQVLTEYIAETKPAIERRCPACGMDDKTVCYDARCPYEMRAERPTAQSAGTRIGNDDLLAKLAIVKKCAEGEEWNLFMSQCADSNGARAYIALMDVMAALSAQSASERTDG